MAGNRAAEPLLGAFWLEFEARITGTRVVKKREHHETDVGKKATHTVFIVRVKGPDGSSYEVERRYTEFASLHAALAPCRFAHPPPPLPKKTVLRFKSKGKAVVEKRIAAFQCLLSEAATLSQREQEPLRRFLTDRAGREQDMVAGLRLHPDISVAIASRKQVSQARLVADALQEAKIAAAQKEAADAVAVAEAAKTEATARAAAEAAAAREAAAGASMATAKAAAAARVGALRAEAAAAEAAAERTAAAQAAATQAAVDDAAAAAMAAREAEVFVIVHKDGKPTYGLTLCSIGHKTFVNVVKKNGAAHDEFARRGLSANDGLMFKAINGVDVSGGKNAVGVALKAAATGATLTILFVKDPAGFEQAKLAPRSSARPGRDTAATGPLAAAARAAATSAGAASPSAGAAAWTAAAQPMHDSPTTASPLRDTRTAPASPPAPARVALSDAASAGAWTAAAQRTAGVPAAAPGPLVAALGQAPFTVPWLQQFSQRDSSFAEFADDKAAKGEDSKPQAASEQVVNAPGTLVARSPGAGRSSDESFSSATLPAAALPRSPSPLSPPSMSPKADADVAVRSHRLSSSPGRKKIQEKRAKLAAIKAKRLARQSSLASITSDESSAAAPTEATN